MEKLSENNALENMFSPLTEDNIVSFSHYFQSIKDSGKENRISEFLIHHFIHWTNDEILLKSDSFSSNVCKYYPHHNRSSLSEIVLYHYFIDSCLTPSTNIASKSKS